MYAPPVDIIIAIALGLLVGVIVAVILLAVLPRAERQRTYVRLLWWRLRGAKTAPEIPAGAIAVEHPDAAVAREALNQRIALARARAETQTAAQVEAQKQVAADLGTGDDSFVLSVGDEIVLLDDLQDEVNETGEAEIITSRRVTDGQG